MAKKADSTPPAPSPSNAGIAPPGILPSRAGIMTSELNSLDELQARVEARSKANAEALQALGSHFGAERWARLLQRAERSGMTVESISELAGRMISARKVHHPKNERAALLGAANGFICAIGLSPSQADVQAFESALAATAV